MSLPEALERAAMALTKDADSIRPANGDPHQLLSTLDSAGAVRVLNWMLVNEPDAGEELVVGWCEDERGIEPLQAVRLSKTTSGCAVSTITSADIEDGSPVTTCPAISVPARLGL